MVETLDIPDIMQADRHDMGFCPGCTHTRVLETLGRVLKKRNLKPQDVCIVSDIGCIGIADRYFTCHTFHGLHGRSVTYAEGLKRARPDLTVIVLIGDGGCGIGTGHLVHTARRNADITVIVCNNFNFGMTGGQHSPTTPPCGLTVTTPHGADAHVMDICSTVTINGAAFAARCSAYTDACEQQLSDAINTPGFALVDVWELCVAHYVGRNKLNPKVLTDLSHQLSLPFDVIARTHSTVPAATSTAPAENAPAVAGITRRSSIRKSLILPRRTEIIVAGSAGQRIRSACGVIGTLVTAANAHAAQCDDFPITVRKGFSVSSLVLSHKPIRNYCLMNPNLVLILSDDGHQRIAQTMDLATPPSVYINDAIIRVDTPRTWRPLPLHNIEKAVGKNAASLAILARLIVQSGMIDPNVLMELATEALTGRHRDDQLRAIAWATRNASSQEGSNP